jgi:hypothetical protein
MSARATTVSEPALRDFFEGRSEALAHAIELSGERGDVSHYGIFPLEEKLIVIPDHLVRVCDSFLAGEVGPLHLEAIAFTLLASEWFDFDARTSEGALVSEVLNQWSAPEINLPITWENVCEWRSLLRGG